MLQIVTNRFLRKLRLSGKVSFVEKTDSRSRLAIQAMDLVAGAITASANAYLDPVFKPNAAKQDLINRFSHLLGWDALHYDTMPGSTPNIWHFPREYRADPDTKPIRLTTI